MGGGAKLSKKCMPQICRKSRQEVKNCRKCTPFVYEFDRCLSLALGCLGFVQVVS